MPRRKNINDEIERENARLAQIEAQREQSLERLKSLRMELAAETQQLGASDPESENGVPRTSQEKIALLHNLFRGRDDVFARHWSSTKTGRKGYSPACANEWVPGVCGKPSVRCGDCDSRALLPFDESVIKDHLLGRHVVGIYPLLLDETCRFLALDFDKKGWVEDVGAFVRTCEDVGLAPAVERSRSGNGAHVWFFFSEPILATSARKLG